MRAYSFSVGIFGCAVAALVLFACGTAEPPTANTDAATCNGATCADDAQVAAHDSGMHGGSGCKDCDAAAMPAKDAANDDDASSTIDGAVLDTVCDALCDYEADCNKSCDLMEDPGCKVEEQRASYYAQCRKDCNAGGDRNLLACDTATIKYARCISGLECKAYDECESDRRRYTEQCLLKPGAMVCPTLCSELEVGCTPFEQLGLRGDACVTDCEKAAEQVKCVEALYSYDECTPGAGYTCKPVGKSCDAAITAVGEQCKALQPVTVDEADLKLCASVKADQCRCGLWPAAKDCETRAERRCLFSLGNGEECSKATSVLATCMADIKECSRDKLRDVCKDEWDAYSEKCTH